MILGPGPGNEGDCASVMTIDACPPTVVSRFLDKRRDKRTQGTSCYVDSHTLLQIHVEVSDWRRGQAMLWHA